MNNFISKISRVKPNETLFIKNKYYDGQIKQLSEYNIDLKTHVNSALVGEINKEILKKITNNAVDLTRISSFILTDELFTHIMDFLNEFNTENVILGGEAFIKVKEYLNKNNDLISYESSELKLNETFEKIIVYYGEFNVNFINNPYLSWEHEYVYFMDTINLDKELESYYNFSDVDNVIELSVDPINLPTSYKLKIE